MFRKCVFTAEERNISAGDCSAPQYASAPYLIFDILFRYATVRLYVGNKSYDSSAFAATSPKSLLFSKNKTSPALTFESHVTQIYIIVFLLNVFYTITHNT